MIITVVIPTTDMSAIGITPTAVMVVTKIAQLPGICDVRVKQPAILTEAHFQTDSIHVIQIDLRHHVPVLMGELRVVYLQRVVFVLLLHSRSAVGGRDVNDGGSCARICTRVHVCTCVYAFMCVCV